MKDLGYNEEDAKKDKKVIQCFFSDEAGK